MLTAKWMTYDPGKIPCYYALNGLAIYVLFDLNVAINGGFAILAGIIPIIQAHVILGLFGIATLIRTGGHLIVMRKYFHALLFFLVLLGFFFYASAVGEMTFERGKRDSRYALLTMLASPKNENIWYIDSKLNGILSKYAGIVPGTVVYDGSSPIFHTYLYRVKNADMDIRVHVLLLKNETKFRVEATPQ